MLGKEVSCEVAFMSTPFCRKANRGSQRWGSLLKFTQTTNGALSSFQYIRKANPTGNRENWGGGMKGREEWELTQAQSQAQAQAQAQHPGLRGEPTGI